MKIIALIAARGGSKRLPGKNIRILGGKPLIVWSIDLAKKIPEICDILVSTDDPEIAAISYRAGANVPWLRPVALATDSASSVDVALHAIDWYENNNGKLDGVLLLQPTSPFRSSRSVSRGIELFRLHQGRPVVAVSPAESHPMWCLKIDGVNMQPFIEGDGLKIRSQDLPLAYTVNGAFYLVSPEDLRSRKSFFGENTVPLLIEGVEEKLDIDTEWDWKVAEMIVSSRVEQNDKPL